MDELPGLSGAPMYPMAVNGSAVVVGESSVGGAPHAFVWTAELGMVDLNTFLAERGIALGGFVLERVSGISADGSTIVGSGTENWTSTGFRIRGFGASGKAIAGDVNGDGHVDGADLAILLGHWG